MWQKIRKLAIPISIKLTTLYSVILFCILVFTSFLTITGLRYTLISQAENDIAISSEKVLSYLADGKPIDQRLLRHTLLPPSVMLKVFDEQGSLLLDSAPKISNYVPTAENIQANEHVKTTRSGKIELRKTPEGETYYIQHLTWQTDRQFNLQFIRTISTETQFLHDLIRSLTIANLIGLCIAIISGVFISRKVLRPIRDITNTVKEIEVTDLGKRILNDESNDELHELSTTLNNMLNRLQSGFEQQRRFVSDASHELRTPITIISGYTDMLDRWGKQNSAALEEGIAAIKSEAANMHSLIEKLLFLAKADQNKQAISKSVTSVEQIIEEVVQETRLIAPNHTIEQLHNDTALIYADPLAIKQMLRVFIENSIKYTPTGGKITINSLKNNNRLNITIEDTGIGIPTEDQSKIFNRFYRVDKSRTKDTGGTGLGLPIAKWIADHHDSTIQLTSILGKGTAVTVHIPLLKNSTSTLC